MQVSTDLPQRTLPTPAFGGRFQWGVATSAAQIEGVQGRGRSIWDAFCDEPGRIVDGSNVLVACEHLQRWRDDVALMQWLGLDAYRFSIAWPRVQPDGQGAWNDDGFAFYDRLIDALLTAGIQPHVTLYHWDLPLALQRSFGGWESRRIVPLFADYAAEVARRFGDRVATLTTLNEPWCTTTKGYETAEFAPGKKDRALAMQVAHHQLLAHGEAIAAVRAIAPRLPLGIVLNHTPAFPARPVDEDRRLARLDDGRNVRWYMDPLFRGHYPPDVLQWLGADAPRVQAGDMARIAQAIDFLGLNFYTRNYVGAQQGAQPAPGRLGVTDMGWEVVPEVLTQHLLRITREYSPPPIYITENGMANADSVVDGRVPDAQRVEYLREHLAAVAQAIALGADVRGYFYWSLLDNFEWEWGYSRRFGLVHVDYATQARLPKDSAHWYRAFIAAQRAAAAAHG
jgi:beta-glucosidase